MLGMTWGDISPWIFYDMGLPLLLVAAAAYLLGCSNGAVIVSKYILRDDVRTHGSGNAGLTNFYRTFGGPLTFVVILTDVLKAVVAVWAGILAAKYLVADELLVVALGKYWAGAFCLLGHMFPCMFHFKGGKGILSGGAIAIMIDWRIALVVWGGFLILAVLRLLLWLLCICIVFAVVLVLAVVCLSVFCLAVVRGSLVGRIVLNVAAASGTAS